MRRCLNREIITHLANPLIWFLKTLGIVLRYLILPVPVPFLCWTFKDHPSVIICIMYIFSILLLDIHMKHRYGFAYGSSFCRIFCTECGFFDVSYQMMVFLGPKHNSILYHLWLKILLLIFVIYTIY